MSSKRTRLLATLGMGACLGLMPPATQGLEIANHALPISMVPDSLDKLEIILPEAALLQTASYALVALRAQPLDLPGEESTVLVRARLYCRGEGPQILLLELLDFFEIEAAGAPLSCAFDLSGLPALVSAGCAEGQIVLELDSPTAGLAPAAIEGVSDATLQLITE